MQISGTKAISFGKQVYNAAKSFAKGSIKPNGKLSQVTDEFVRKAKDNITGNCGNNIKQKFEEMIAKFVDTVKIMKFMP